MSAFVVIEATVRRQKVRNRYGSQSSARNGLKHGVVTLCIGGGQGVALALETIA